MSNPGSLAAARSGGDARRRTQAQVPRIATPLGGWRLPGGDTSHRHAGTTKKRHASRARNHPRPRAGDRGTSPRTPLGHHPSKIGGAQNEAASQAAHTPRERLRNSKMAGARSNESWSAQNGPGSAADSAPPAMLELMAGKTIMERVTAFRRQRHLISDRRAGRFARRKALRKQEQFIRELWPYLLGLALLPDLLIPGVWLVRREYRGFLVGLIIPTGPWLAVGTIIVFSGASSAWMGRMGEIWTAQELRRARRKGWTFLNDLHLTSQIDHVALGPGGILVIETKWAGEPWQLDDIDDWRRAKTLGAVNDQASHVRSIMRSHHCSAPVIPVVVQWRPPTDSSPGTWHREGDAILVDGPSFRTWLSSLPDQDYDAAAAAAGWEKLLSHIDPRDQRMEAEEGPAPRTVGQLLWLVAEPLLVGLVALYCAGSLAKLLKPTEALLAAGGLALLGFLAALKPTTRKVGLTWGGTILVGYLVAFAIVLTRHFA